MVQLKQSSVKTETDCAKGVRFYVLADPILGTGYFNVWIPELNDGDKYGPFAYGWSDWIKLAPGKYDYRIATETKTDSGKVYQCDRAHGAFAIPECKCVQPPAPDCRYGPPVYNSRNCTWSCPDCVMPDEPECPYGPAVPDYEACSYSCPPCVLPDEPECPFGPAIPDMEACDWSCPPCEIQCEEPKLPNLDTCSCECPPPGEPECVEQRYDEETCSWVGECLTCEDIELEPGCYPGNIDNATQFKEFFEVPETMCIERTYRLGDYHSSCIMSPYSAKWVVVKGGPGFRLYQDVKKWDWLCTYCTGGFTETTTHRPDISHISFFGCCR